MVTTRARRYPSRNSIAAEVDAAIASGAARLANSATMNQVPRQWGIHDADRALSEGTAWLDHNHGRTVQMPLSGQIAAPDSNRDRNAALAAAGLVGAGTVWGLKKIYDRFKSRPAKKAVVRKGKVFI